MAYPSCSPPKSQGVKSHTRSSPRKLKKKAPTSYWECRKGGHSCGVHHKTQSSALRHAVRLDKAARRRGQRADWHAYKVG